MADEATGRISGRGLGSIAPDRAWILGLTVEPDGRVEPQPHAQWPIPTPSSEGATHDESAFGTCNCPDACPRDHPNE